jgi:hypothetical protein
MSQLTQLPIDGLRRELGPCCSFELGSVYLVHLLALVSACPFPSSQDGQKSLGTRTHRFRRDLQTIVDPKINTRRVTKGSTAGIVVRLLVATPTWVSGQGIGRPSIRKRGMPANLYRPGIYTLGMT